MSYENFAAVYDTLMTDADYPARVRYIAALFEKYDRMPSLMLDLACGTGGFSSRFAENGVDVIGVDSSAAMLSAASAKGGNVLYLCQNACGLDLYGTVDGAISCMDSLNHLTEYSDFCCALSRVSLFLEPERLFIFDLNTCYKHEKILADNCFLKKGSGVYCIWQNEYAGHGLTNIELDFFVDENGLYRHFSERFSERAYSFEDVKNALSQTGFLLVAALGDMSFDSPAPDAERVYYVAKKVQ